MAGRRPSRCRYHGSSLSEKQAELTAEAATVIGKVILMFDDDEAGRKGQEHALCLASKVFVRTIDLGKEGMQPDQLPAQEILELHK